MICPNCKAEYVEGILRCAECNVDLVDELPEEDTLICDNCNNEIDENESWCPHCGGIFEQIEEKCNEHDTLAIGKCLICQKALCEKDIITVKNKYFCKKHSHYDFTENGWVCIYETGQDWEAELVKQDLENNNIPSIVDNRKDHSRQFTIGHLSLIYVRVPFKYVLDAEKILKK